MTDLRAALLESPASALSEAFAELIANDDVLAQIERIHRSRVFERSPALRDLLGHICTKTLAGEAEQLKEYAIGVDVFGRGGDFDTRSDSIVRAQAGRLRAKLDRYYAGEGSDDAIEISIPKGHYVLVATARGSIPVTAGPVLPHPAPNNLPAAIGPLVGRSGELATLSALVDAHRLVTICGTGGLGKTRLAVELGRSKLDRFADGVWFITLDRLTDPALVAESVLTALGLSVEGARRPIDTVVRHLRGRQVLLILDNVEHVLQAAGELVDAVLAGAAQSRVVVTSRESLGIAEEHLFPAPALSVPPPSTEAGELRGYPAVELFIRRGEAALGRFEPDAAELQAIAAICRRVDGIPLAIELAAARLNLLAAQQLEATLAERFAVLARLSGAGPSRQRTLQATLDWSFALLGEAEQVLLRRMSVFAGGWTLASATAVAAYDGIDEADILDLMSKLVAKSLVVVEADAMGPRCRMLETTRSFAADRRRAAGDTVCERLLAEVMIAIVERAQANIETSPTYASIALYTPELDNLRSALAWAFGSAGDTAIALRLTAFSVQMFVDIGIINEPRRWLEKAYTLIDGDTPPAVSAHILMALAFRFTTGVAGADALCARACECARLAGEPTLLARALLTHIQTLRLHDPRRVPGLIEEAFSLLDPLGPTKAQALAFASRALSASIGGDFDAADRDFACALHLAARFDYRFGSAWVSLLMLEHALLAGNLAAAEATATAAWEAAEKSGLRAFMGVTANLRAASASLRGDVAGSIAWARRALDYAIDLQDSLVSVAALESLALAVPDQRLDDAVKLLGFASATRKTLLSLRRPSEAAVVAMLQSRWALVYDDEARQALMSSGEALAFDDAIDLAFSCFE